MSLFRRQLLVEIARKQGYSKVMLDHNYILVDMYIHLHVECEISLVLCVQVLMGDTATRLAVRLIGNVAQGRGRTLPLDTVRQPTLLLTISDLIWSQ